MNCKALSFHTRRGIAAAVGAAALLLVGAVSPAQAARITPPVVPANLQVDAGSRVFLVGHALGTQNYVCSPSPASPSGVAYVLFTPIATLFDNHGRQITTHFFSPNPNVADPNTNPAVIADGAIRPTWQAKDNSSVWVKLHANGSANVTPGALAWLLLDVAGTAEGLGGGDLLTKTTQIHRVNTVGGLAPAQGCASVADVGHSAFVDYAADYYFYTKRN